MSARKVQDTKRIDDITNKYSFHIKLFNTNQHSLLLIELDCSQNVLYLRHQNQYRYGNNYTLK